MQKILLDKQVVEQALEALDEFIGEELLVGQRYTNAGQKLMDSHINLRDALEVSNNVVNVEAQQAAGLMAWRPIDTAPKDGQKVILFYLNSHNNARTVMARWMTDEEAAETDWDGDGLKCGWYEVIDNWDEYIYVAIYQGEPTYWMPLPDVPEAAHSITNKTGD